ncbi:phytanoyl-CoA dioxygenase, peroxisomal-like [Coccinella septempunctata]|uniref:phytanoyl-CoA dioxygenase, peroxisomal-like n=1 Tax=Coccinella septempunctata TaxID=41139 RepID=UPI001D06405C|nr:phytanoyl-CoA dioxygenase, peroxisomal-like [Coccinella septempunctata]
MTSKYRYTVSSKGLTDEQRKAYDENGYVLVKNLFPHSLLNEFSSYFDDVCTGKIATTSRMVKDPLLKKLGVKGESAIFKLQDFLNDDFLFRYATYKPLLDVVESIIGPDIIAVNSMLINKPPDAHPDLSRYPIHQDLHYLPFRPVNTTVASWTAMESINKEHGCLFTFPGSHKKEELYPHDYPQGLRNPLFHGVTSSTEGSRTYVTMEKGDTMFFHPLLLHGSRPNLTAEFRKVISCHFTSTNSYFIDVKGTSQEGIMKEMVDYMNGWVEDYMVIWKLKSRHVSGKNGSLLNIQNHL